MQRTSQLFIRLSVEEREKIDRMAKRAHLPSSTAARQILLNIADRMEREAGSHAQQQEAT